MFPELNFHHCMCEGMIDIQTSIAAQQPVKFVKFMGANRFFNVCCRDSNGGEDFFLNRIQNLDHFNSELSKYLQNPVHN